MSGVRHLRILGLGSALEQWEYPRGTFVWSSVTADVGLIRNAALTLIQKTGITMQPSRNFDDLKFSSFTAAFCCGEAVVRFWMVMYCNDWRGAGATDAGAETGR